MYKDADYLAPRLPRETSVPLPALLPALFYLFAVLSVSGAMVGLALPESRGNLLVCGIGLLLAGGCCVTAEVVRLLIPTDDRLQ